MVNKKKYVIIVAGGKGLRMGKDIPKQFLLLNGKPVLMHTLEKFYEYDNEVNQILVLPSEQQDYWRSLCKQHKFNLPHQITSGGDTRFHSVANGLSLISDEHGLVAVHDGVRPFVSLQVIEACFNKAEKYKAVIPVIDVVETVRFVSNDENRTVDRNNYKLVQTPQVFDLALLKKAYQQTYSEQFTDDASVVEAMGSPVYPVNGNRENIKITTPFDLLVGEAILKSNS